MLKDAAMLGEVFERHCQPNAKNLHNGWDYFSHDQALTRLPVVYL
jgi:hypothetical protein